MSTSELSSKAVDERLRALSALHALGLSLAASQVAIDYRRHALPVCSRLSERALEARRPGLSCWPLGEGDVAVFCAFSPRTIHVGSALSTLYEATGLVVRGRASLVSVTQPGTRPSDCIPRGHKTVCVFRTTGAIAASLAALPMDDNWDTPRLWVI